MSKLIKYINETMSIQRRNKLKIERRIRDGKNRK